MLTYMLHSATILIRINPPPLSSVYLSFKKELKLIKFSLKGWPSFLYYCVDWTITDNHFFGPSLFSFPSNPKKGNIIHYNLTFSGPFSIKIVTHSLERGSMAVVTSLVWCRQRRQQEAKELWRTTGRPLANRTSKKLQHFRRQISSSLLSNFQTHEDIININYIKINIALL